MPKISVWLTSYNHGEELRESIESVLNQTFQDFELVIVDDCSTDNSRSIIDEYAERNSKIRKIYHEKNIGKSGFEDEIDGLQGEYIAILNGDDKWDERKLELQIDVLECNAQIAACFTGVKTINSKGKEYDESSPYTKVFITENRTRYDLLRYFFEVGNCLCHSSLLIRKNAYEQYGLLGNEIFLLLGQPDFYKWVKLCLGAEVYVIPDLLTTYRRHEDESNASGETAEKQNRRSIEEYYVYRNYFSIDDVETMIRIFPYSEKYVIQGECVIKFALAKVFIEAPRNVQKFLGFNMIYELLQNEESKKKIEELYGYGEKEFDLEKQRYDIFGMIERERCLYTRLFFDTGSDYNDNECISKIVYAPIFGLLNISYDLKFFSGKKQVQRIRFDLDENIYRRAKILDAKWSNGKEAEIRSVNGVRKDGWDYFYTLDPQYEIKPLKDMEVLQLTLRVESLYQGIVEAYFQSLKDEVNEYRSLKIVRMLNKLRKKIKMKRVIGG